MFKDILLPLPSWPRTAPRPALRRALDAARLLESHVTGLVNEPTLPLPVAFHPYSERFEIELNTRQSEAHETAVAELAAFEEEARRAGVSHEGRLVTLAAGVGWEPVVEYARLRDLTVVPFLDDDENSAELVQALVFESGRPVLVLPGDGGESFGLGRIVVGWDFSRAAARAVGDAMPLLQRAQEVRVVTVANDKQPPESASGPEFTAHLARNGVRAVLDEVERGGRSVGEALDAAAADADLLVMGAFGHSRIRDFFLGGATRHLLRKPRLPTLLSH